jgi:hypothetical protein
MLVVPGTATLQPGMRCSCCILFQHLHQARLEGPDRLHTLQAHTHGAHGTRSPYKPAAPHGVYPCAGEDRCDHDPQLAALHWLTEVTGTKIGRWPVAEVAVKMSASPAYIGGRLDRGAPCYGEDNDYVYGELLGMSAQEIKELAEEGVI